MLSDDEVAELMGGLFDDGAVLHHGPLTLTCVEYGEARVWRVEGRTGRLDTLNPNALRSSTELKEHLNGLAELAECTQS